MAEPKDDPDETRFIDKIANHLGNSRLEENLNDFLELHSEELRLELRRQDPSRWPDQTDDLDLEEEEEEEEEEEDQAGRNEDHAEGLQHVRDGDFSQRVHELYQEFLQVVQANLEELLEAEGLTGAQLRDACEKEMEAKHSRGDCFMHTLISSWEFSRFARGSCECLSNLASPSKEEGAGGDELKIGLVDRFGARIFQAKNPKCNEGENKEPTGKDSNQSVYGRSGSSVVVLGMATEAPEQRHSDDIELWRTDKHYV